MSVKFKRGELVVFNNNYGSLDKQKEVAVYYCNYGISDGDKGKITRRNTNGWVRVKFNDTIISMRQHNLIKYDDVSDIESDVTNEVIIESNDDWTTPDISVTEDNDKLEDEICILKEKINDMANIMEARQLINNVRVKQLEERNLIIMARLDKFQEILTMSNILNRYGIQDDNDWDFSDV